MTISESLNILNLRVNFTDDDLRKAYKKKCAETHPDNGGSTSDFSKVQSAYNVLKKEKANAQPQFGRAYSYKVVHDSLFSIRLRRG